MRITKHHQSCILIDVPDGGRVGIDLGTRPHGRYDLDQIGALDAVMYTHRHADHLDLQTADALLERDIPLFGNADVVEALDGRPATTLVSGQPVQVAGAEVLPIDIPHAVMIDGTPGPPNTGLLVDGRLLHPGDGLDVDEVHPEVLAVPIAGPSISLHDAYAMVDRIRPGTVVPIHYDVFPADPARFADACANLAHVVVLGHGESTNLP